MEPSTSQQSHTNTSFTCSLILSRAAKSSGGDKYSAIFQSCSRAAQDRERFIYVPQQYSRGDHSEPTENLRLEIFLEDPKDESAIPFACLKKAKSQGDDRYSCPTTWEAGKAGNTWSGDIYLPKELRSENIWMIIS